MYTQCKLKANFKILINVNKHKHKVKEKDLKAYNIIRYKLMKFILKDVVSNGAPCIRQYIQNQIHGKGSRKSKEYLGETRRCVLKITELSWWLQLDPERDRHR